MKGKELTKFHEGEKLTAYQDTKGFWTIGVGHLLDEPRNPKWRGYKITKEASDQLFELDWQKHIALVQTYASWAMEFDEVRKFVVVDMTFNLGVEPFDGDGFNDWPLFVSQLRAHNGAAAAANMTATRWASQVKSRAARLAKMIETGTWPREHGVPVIA
jgi:lysozyme